MPKRPVVFHPVVRKDFITFFAGNLNCPIGGTVCRRIYRFSRTMLYRQCCFIAVAFFGFRAAFPLACEFLNAGCIAAWLFCNFAIIILMPQSRLRYFNFPFGIPAYRADDPLLSGLRAGCGCCSWLFRERMLAGCFNCFCIGMSFGIFLAAFPLAGISDNSVFAAVMDRRFYPCII